MTYQDAVREIESYGIMPQRAPSLEPMKWALDLLATELEINPDSVIVVAGTNGKGSVCASLEALLLAAGETVGLYTSPHLEETTERFRVNGKDISEDIFTDAYQQISQRVSSVVLSHFEILTLIAAWIFFSGRYFPVVQRPIFEVGLGGIWDATNAIPHRNSVITSLSLDHENLLGNTLTEIARNKFGIIGARGRVIHARLPGEVLPLAHHTREQTQSRWRESVPYQVSVESVKPIEPIGKDAHQNTPRFTVETEWGRFPLQLAGLRAGENSALALTVFHELGFNPSDYRDALSTVRWPGRMEKFDHPGFPCPLFLSGDHNPQGVSSLIELLKFYPYKNLHILVGVGTDKNLDGILNPLWKHPRTHLYLTETPFKGRTIAQYGSWAARAKGTWKNPMEGLNYLRTQVAAPGDLVLISGSLYLVGQLRRELRQELLG